MSLENFPNKPEKQSNSFLWVFASSVKKQKIFKARMKESEAFELIFAARPTSNKSMSVSELLTL